MRPVLKLPEHQPEVFRLVAFACAQTIQIPNLCKWQIFGIRWKALWQKPPGGKLGFVLDTGLLTGGIMFKGGFSPRTKSLYPFKEELLREIKIFYALGCWIFNPTAFQSKAKTIPKATGGHWPDLYVWLGSKIICLDSLGHWCQRFGHILSWLFWISLDTEIQNNQMGLISETTVHLTTRV